MELDPSKLVSTAVDAPWNRDKEPLTQAKLYIHDQNKLLLLF